MTNEFDCPNCGDVVEVELPYAATVTCPNGCKLNICPDADFANGMWHDRTTLSLVEEPTPRNEREEQAYEREKAQLDWERQGWPGDGSGIDDLADYNANEADDYRHEGYGDSPEWFLICGTLRSVNGRLWNVEKWNHASGFSPQIFFLLSIKNEFIIPYGRTDY